VREPLMITIAGRQIRSGIGVDAGAAGRKNFSHGA
jgi:hypothetical protein